MLNSKIEKLVKQIYNSTGVSQYAVVKAKYAKSYILNNKLNDLQVEMEDGCLVLALDILESIID